MESIEEIFENVRAQLPHLDIQLASGAPVDSKGPLTSDVDGIIILPDHDNVDFGKLEVIGKERKEDTRTLYHIGGYKRQVEITVSSDWTKLKSVQHRRVILSLLKFEKVSNAVCELKKSGVKTEPAWAQVLKLQGDPYIEMLRCDLIPIAEVIEKELNELTDL